MYPDPNKDDQPDRSSPQNHENTTVSTMQMTQAILAQLLVLQTQLQSDAQASSNQEKEQSKRLAEREAAMADREQALAVREANVAEREKNVAKREQENHDAIIRLNAKVAALRAGTQTSDEIRIP